MTKPTVRELKTAVSHKMMGDAGIMDFDRAVVQLIIEEPRNLGSMFTTQPSNYSALYQMLGSIVPDNTVFNELDNWTAIVSAEDEGKGKFPRLPMMTAAKIERFRSLLLQANEQREPGIGLAWVIAVAPVVEALFKVLSPPRMHSSNQLQFAIAVGRYTAARSAEALGGTIQSDIDAEISSAKTKLFGATNEIDATLNERRSTHDAMIVNYKEFETKLAAADQALESTRAELLAFKGTIRAQLELEGARKSWTGLSASSLWTAKLAGFAVVALIATPFLVLPFIADNLVYFINKPDLGSLFSASITGSAFAHQLTKLVVLTIPTVAYFWALRVAVRFYTRSLAVYDDARHRSVMLETYFNLTSENRANDADKPIVLSALFRPGPSVASDNNDGIDLAAVVEGVAKSQR